MTACSGDAPLSASSAKKALKKEALFAKDSQVRQFEVGFQEVTETHLQRLAQLRAAGVIEYTTEKAIETRKEREWGGFWTGYYTRTREITHIFADVKLTPAGEKLVVEEPTTLRADVLKDLKANKDYEEIVPDYMSATDNAFGGEVVEVVEATEEMEDDDEVVVVMAEEVADSVEVADSAVVETPKPVVDNSNPNAMYESMLSRCSTESVYVLLGRFEVVKVKEVLCTEDMFKAGKGSCTVIFKFVDKTPFGYVYGAPDENYLMSNTASFIYYQDLGWTATLDD